MKDGHGFPVALAGVLVWYLRFTQLAELSLVVLSREGLLLFQFFHTSRWLHGLLLFMVELADGDGGFVEDGGKRGFEFLPGCDAARLAELIEGLREGGVPALVPSLGRTTLL